MSSLDYDSFDEEMMVCDMERVEILGRIRLIENELEELLEKNKYYGRPFEYEKIESIKLSVGKILDHFSGGL